MSRSYGEVLETINEVEQPFTGGGTGPLAGIWARNDGIEDFLAATWDMLLPDHLTHKEPVYSHDIDDDIAMLMGLMAGPFEIHIDGAGERDRARADKHEDFDAAWCIKHGLTPGSWRYNEMLRIQACKVAGAIWLEVQDKVTPSRDLKKEPRTTAGNAAYNARVDRYEAEWDGMNIAIDPLRTTAWREHDHIPTIATRSFEMEYFDIARRFGDYKRGEERSPADEQALMLKIMNEQYGFIRGGENIPLSGGSEPTARRRCKIRMLDDGLKICWYVEGFQTLGGQAYTLKASDQELLSEIDNPFARVSLFPISGRYYGGEPMQRRFQPILLALMQKYMSRDFLRSFLASHMMSAIMDGVEVTGEAAASLMGLSGEELAAKAIQKGGEDTLTIIPGKGVSMSANAEQIALAKDQLAAIENDLVRLRPASQYTGGLDAQKMIQEGTMGAIMRMDEVTQLPLKAPADIRTKLINDILDAKDHYYLVTTNAHYVPGSHKTSKADSRITLSVLPGQVAPKGRKLTPGTALSFAPADIDIKGMTRTVTTRNESLSARAARGAEADRRWFRSDGTHAITFAENVQENSGEENITEYLKELDEDQFFQEDVDTAIQTSHDIYLVFMEHVLGAAEGSLSQSHGIQVDGAQPAPQGEPTPPAGAGNIPRAPFVQTPQGASTS